MQMEQVILATSFNIGVFMLGAMAGSIYQKRKFSSTVEQIMCKLTALHAKLNAERSGRANLEVIK